MPRYAVDWHVIVEVDATSEAHAMDKVRDLLVSDEVIRTLPVKCKAIKWETTP